MVNQPCFHGKPYSFWGDFLFAAREPRSCHSYGGSSFGWLDYQSTSIGTVADISLLVEIGLEVCHSDMK